MKMFVFEALSKSSWLTLTLFGISVYWILKKLAERIRISDLQHKAVFITNCDGEIGQEIALKCAKHELVVYAGFSKIESRLVLEQRARQTQTHIITVPFDMSNEQDISHAVEFVKKDLPKDTKLWALINTPNECDSHDPHQLDEFKQAMEFNYMSEIRCTHAFIPLLKKSGGGRIAITKSISEELILRWGNNKVHKTALNSYLENLAMELQHTKIKIGVFEPGVFRSNYLCQEAIQQRVDQLSRKISVEERQKLVEYRAKILNHWSRVFEHHGMSSTHSIVKSYFHFIVGRFPHPYYKCGPSVVLRSIYLFFLGWAQTIKSLMTTPHKGKHY